MTPPVESVKDLGTSIDKQFTGVKYNSLFCKGSNFFSRKVVKEAIGTFDSYTQSLTVV